MTEKRHDFLTWEQYFMGVALLASKRSKDPSTQVGACIVNEDNIIVSTGYNGMPKGCDDSVMPWAREGAIREVKYTYVCHAELNAILNSGGRSLKGCTVYTTLFPCNECAKAIIQCGIKEVIYYSDKYNGTEHNLAAKEMFAMAGVDYKEYQGDEWYNTKVELKL